MSEFWLGFTVAMSFIGLPVFATMIWAYKIYRKIRRLDLTP